MLTTVTAELLRMNLRKFTYRAWSRIEGAPMVNNWHIDAICDHLAFLSYEEIRFLMIACPPRHTKTLIVSVIWPAWHWISWPEEKFLTASYAKDLALDSSRKSRHLIESNWYQMLYGNRFQMSSDNNQIGRYSNTKGGHRVTISVDGRTTGEGGTIQIGDDLNNAKEVESDKSRASTLAWHDNAFRSRVNDPNRSRKVYVAQRTHEEDVMGHVLEQEADRWVYLELPLEFDTGRKCITHTRWKRGEKGKQVFSDPRTKDGELLDPKRFNAETAKAEKSAMANAQWEAQYQQNPQGKQGLILLRKYWKPWTYPAWHSMADQEMQLPELLEVVQTYDTAFEEDEQADFSARTTWGLFYHSESILDEVTGQSRDGPERVCAILLDHYHDQAAFPDLRKEMVRSNKELQPDKILIEKKASGHSLIQEGRRAHLPIRAVLVKGDKVSRAHMAAVVLEQGCIYYLPRSWSFSIISECAAFPNGKNDDYVDTCVMAFQYMRKYHDLAFEHEEEDENELELDLFRGRVLRRA